jgi:glycosyltransferase involved in cell wall biosynthesis
VLYHWWGTDTLRPWLDEPGRPTDAPRPVFIAVLHRSGMTAPGGYDAYVLVTPTQREQVAQVDRERVHVVPNGVDLSRFQTGSAPLAGTRPFTVGRLSNLRPGKIPEDWVRTAWSFGLAGARFVIAGDGPLRPSLEAQAWAVGGQETFRFPGYVPRGDVPRLLATFDVFCYVTSSAVECHPIALLEAAAAGVPIVAESRGGIPDIVDDGVSGLLTEEAAGIGPLLHRLRTDTVLRARLSAGARGVAARFHLRRIGSRT